MRFSLFSLILLGLATNVYAQMPSSDGILYGNEWIDYDKKYYKIKVGEDGIYRLTQDQLVSLGVDLNGKSPKDIQLWSYGKQVPIHTSSTSFSSDFYFDFYGEKHTIQMDSFMLDDWRANLFNDKYSLITDTSAYFLTFDSSEPNQRIETVSPDYANNTIAPLDYHMYTSERVMSNAHYKPADADKVQYSNYERSEGFANTSVVAQSQINIDVQQIYNNSPETATLQFKIGSNRIPFQERVYSLNGTEVGTRSSVSSNAQFNETYDIPVADLKTGNNLLQINNIDAFNGRNRIAYCSITYPRNFAAANATTYTANLGAGSQYLEVSGFGNANEAIAFDPTNNTRYITASNGSQVQLLMNRQNAGKVIIYGSADYLQPALDGEITFTDISVDDSQYLILYSQRMIDEAEPQNKNVITEYLDYRSSDEGGGFSTFAVAMEDIENQFGYGLQMHPHSISNMIQYLEEQWRRLEYVFIIGKGVEYSDVRKANQEDNRAKHYVPTFGAPGSDLLMFTYGESLQTDLIHGRIAVISAKQALDYLDKIKGNQQVYTSPSTLENRGWLKQVIHLSGGGNAGEQQAIRRRLDVMTDTLSNNKFGADVATFGKTSTTPLQPATVAEIFQRINSGVSFITFFGHSSVGTFDFSIEEPSEYSNQGKLPIIISLGCLSGNIYSKTTGLSERFVLQEETGSIAFFASGGTAFIGTQGTYGAKLYSAIGREDYGNTLGEAIRTVRKQYNESTLKGEVTLMQQLILHGDPAINVTGQPSPDYSLNYSSVNTKPTIVTAADPSFEINLDVQNLGTSINDSIDLQIIIAKDDSKDRDTLLQRISAPAFSKTITFEVENQTKSRSGFNTIYATVDHAQEVDELPSPAAELNNTLVDENTGQDGFKFFVADNTVKPLYPSEFGIVGDMTINFVAASNNGFAGKKEYIFEIDTTELFDSPFKIRTTVEGIGGLIEWNTSIEQLTPNTVYYWRVSPDLPYTNGDYLWQTSSFIYLPGIDNGWNQSHYYQYLKDDYDFYEIGEDRDFAFDTSGFFIKIFNGVWDGGINVGYEFNFESFATSVRPWNFMRGGMAVVIGDKTSGGAQINNGGDFGSINTSNFGSFRSFGYNTSIESQRHGMMDLINAAEDGSFIFVFSVFKTDADTLGMSFWEDDQQSYGKTLFDVFEENGASLVDRFKERGDVPYTFVFRKGFNAIGEGIASEKTENIITEAFIPVKSLTGNMTSTIVGPAISWKTFIWDNRHVEDADSVSYNILGQRSNGSYDTLYTGIQVQTTDLSPIDPLTYRYLKLEQYSEDQENRTATQLNYWRVIYDGLPDVGIKLVENFNFKDSLQQGETLALALKAKNLTATPMDSLLVKYSYKDKDNQVTTEYKKFKALDKYEEIDVTVSKSTKDFLGDYNLEVELNPDEDQIEEIKINNSGLENFKVYPDKTNPIFDVTFDGYQILDDDLVAPKPLIKVSLSDENQYLLLTDPKNISMTLTYPDASAITFDGTSPQAKFVPASDLNNNDAYLEINPELPDGEYTLGVQALDNTGNASGDKDYTVNFRVITKKQVTEVLNYPNPFSTSTQFVFNITGEVPTDILIRIMTMSGKVVKEITGAELGPLRVGTNLTDYKWDGTDEYGNKLGNGVYLYRVITKDASGKQYDILDVEQLESYFTKGFGKLVIMR